MALDIYCRWISSYNGFQKFLINKKPACGITCPSVTYTGGRGGVIPILAMRVPHPDLAWGVPHPDLTGGGAPQSWLESTLNWPGSTLSWGTWTWGTPTPGKDNGPVEVLGWTWGNPPPPGVWTGKHIENVTSRRTSYAIGTMYFLLPFVTCRINYKPR